MSIRSVRTASALTTRRLLSAVSARARCHRDDTAPVSTATTITVPMAIQVATDQGLVCGDEVGVISISTCIQREVPNMQQFLVFSELWPSTVANRALSLDRPAPIRSRAIAEGRYDRRHGNLSHDDRHRAVE